MITVDIIIEYVYSDPGKTLNSTSKLPGLESTGKDHSPGKPGKVPWKVWWLEASSKHHCLVKWAAKLVYNECVISFGILTAILCLSIYYLNKSQSNNFCWQIVCLYTQVHWFLLFSFSWPTNNFQTWLKIFLSVSGIVLADLADEGTVNFQFVQWAGNFGVIWPTKVIK